MAEQKIAAAERAAADSLRREAAGAAVSAARAVIAGNYGETEDRKLADEIISSI
jgi:F0F1-type ATP synthase membrane subunit b/b'